MSDDEFLESLRHELTTGAGWSDIAGVGTHADEPDLFANELRVYPVAEDPAQQRVSVFRLLCEWEIRPSRTFRLRLRSQPRPTAP